MSQPRDNAFLQQSLGLGEERRKPVFGEERPLTFPERRAPPADDSLEYARYESAERLRLKWESIYERFKDAHLQDQDEIYLGHGDDKIRVVKDRGSLRALQKQLRFGAFMSEEEREALALGGGDEEVDEDAYAAEAARERPAAAVPPPPTDADVALELDIYRSVKRDAVDSLLRTNTLGRAPLPYSIPGLEAICTKELHTHERE